ncbi:MAG: 50S ribosomal protein L6 [Calditrichaeota bacterium]|nr:MAG: 50S ribosomal protein L6 [Calditrichota bacterium]
MSRIGKLPVEIPTNVSVSVNGNSVTVKGAKGELKLEIHPEISVKFENNILSVGRPSDSKTHKALHGLSRALLSNMVVGVTTGYSKTLEIQGVGYRVELKNGRLILNLGYSHPIVFVPPKGITIETPNQISIIISGVDKEAVGQVAAKIRSLRKPEPYKGKGIRYQGEYIFRKAGKKAGK